MRKISGGKLTSTSHSGYEGSELPFVCPGILVGAGLTDYSDTSRCGKDGGWRRPESCWKKSPVMTLRQTPLPLLLLQCETEENQIY